MIYIGVDPSTKDVACVAKRGDDVLTRSYALKGRDVLNRVAAAYLVPGRFTAYVERVWGPSDVLVALEAPIVMRGGQTTVKLGQVSGALVAGFYHEAGTMPILVPVTTWKKEIIGKGNATKDQIKEWVRDYWPEFHRRAADDQDTLDAACIARYAEAVGERARTTTDAIMGT